MYFARKCLLFLVLLGLSQAIWSQDLEPRRWSRLPVGANFIGFAASDSTGDIFFDPVLQNRDVTLDYAVLGSTYIRTFGLFDKLARIDINVPYASGHWQGLHQGVPRSLRLRGFMDPRIRFSMNLWGAPALKGREFGQFMAENPVNTTVGAAVAIYAPLGEYRQDKLINLGNNRWTLRPQLGILHERYKWEFETTAAAFVYGDNTEFFPGQSTLSQDPLWSIQGHVIYTFRPGLWTSLSAAYVWGGESKINNVPLDDKSELTVWGLSLGVPITHMQGLKFVYYRSKTHTDIGSDLDTFQLAWSLMLGK